MAQIPTIEMHSVEGSPTTTVSSSTSVHTVSTENNDKPSMGQYKEDSSSQFEQFPPLTTSARQQGGQAEASNEAVSAIQMHEDSSSEPEEYRAHSTRPKQIEMGQGSTDIKTCHSLIRQGSLDSAFVPDIFPRHQENIQRRKLQYSASWPTESSNFRLISTSFLQHGDQQKLYEERDLHQDNPRQLPQDPHFSCSLERQSSSEATSPTQEIAHALHKTHLQSPPSQQSLPTSTACEFQQTSEQLTTTSSYFPNVPMDTSSSSDQARMLNPSSYAQCLETGSPFGEQMPNPEQRAIASECNPHFRQNISVNTRESFSGRGSSWDGVSSGASAMPFPYQPPGRGASSTYPHTLLPSAFPHSTASLRGNHPFPMGNPYALATMSRRLMWMPTSHEESIPQRSPTASGGASPMPRRDLTGHYQQQQQQQQRRKHRFPTNKMLQVVNQMPTWPMQQTNQSNPNETDFNLERFLQEEPWGSTALPSIASAFIPRAPSPGQFSTTSTNTSEPPEYMDLDPPSPAPSNISDASSISLIDIEILIFDEIRRGIIDVCQEISISPDPYQWSIEEVDRWIRKTCIQYDLPSINMDYFHVDGVTLCNLREEDFKLRAPTCGDVIFPHLDVWKTAASQRFPPPPAPCPEPEPTTDPGFSSFALPYPVPQLPLPLFQPHIKLEPHDECETASIASASSSDDQSIPSPTQSSSGPDTSMTPNHTGSIHLWQFLKELLLQPDSYGYCIRWLDRSQGIFKIEDSVKVATLWGRRKNRPAMNYDKMSRSMRQYYKKGIMKKTEVSQRLVYQFVNPC